MTVVLRKDFFCLLLRNSSYLCESRVPFSTPFPFHHCYSSSAEKKPVINREVYDLLLKKHHFSPEAARKVASSIPRLRDPENSDSLLSFLKINDFSNSHLEKILKYRPSFISASLENIVNPKIKIFQDLGFSGNDIADFCASNPSTFFRSTNNTLIPAISVLRTLLGSDANVVKLLVRCGWFLCYDLEKLLMPNIEFLKSHSVPMEQIIRSMRTSPRFLLQRPEIVRRCAEKAEELGASPCSSNMYIHAVMVISTMRDEAWELKLEAFRSLGFSEGDISNAFSKYPTFAVSVKKMREVRDVLVSTGRYDEASIAQYPMSLASSVEKRFKPRLRVLAALEGKGLIKKWPSLASLCTQSDLCFFGKYVSSHMDEVGHLFTVKSA